MSSQQQHHRKVIFLCFCTLIFYGIIGAFSFSTVTTNRALVSRQRRRSPSPSSLLFLSATTNNEDNYQNKNKNERRKTTTTKSNVKQKNLYEILNASPNDSRQQLHRKYTAMARLTHPDAQLINNNTTAIPSELPSFPDVANAWRILSNPKERLRYDRSLQAEAFTSRASSLIDTGFSVAAPFLFETAPQKINKTASDWGRTMGIVGERMGRARVVLELKIKANDLVQKASLEAKRAKDLRNRRDMMQSRGGGDELSRRRWEIVEDETLSSDRGYAMVRDFEYLDDTSACAAALDALAEAEQQQTELTTNQQRLQTIMDATTKKMTTAANDEALIRSRIDEETRKLTAAQSSCQQWTTERALREKKGKEASSQRTMMEDRLTTARNDEERAMREFEEAKRRLADARTTRATVESQYRRAADEERTAVQNLRAADDTIASVLKDQDATKRRIDEERRRWDEARIRISGGLQREFAEVERERMNVTRALADASAVVERRREAARSALRRSQDQNVANGMAALKKEIRKTETKAAKLYANADVLKRKAESLEEQQQRID